jgi:molecular chaperone DnaK
VLQGERPLASENKSLGRFILDGVLPAPRGVPQIEVTFDIDANGILNVSARDTASGKEQRVTVTASSGLSKADVERMVKEAEAHAAEDQQRRQEIELRNQTDSLVYQVQRALAEHGAKLSESERAEIEQALTEARDALAGEDLERIRRAQEGLTRASSTLAQAMSREPAGAGAGAGPQGGDRPGNGEVVDAEFEDVDERKAS